MATTAKELAALINPRWITAAHLDELAIALRRAREDAEHGMLCAELGCNPDEEGGGHVPECRMYGDGFHRVVDGFLEKNDIPATHWRGYHFYLGRELSQRIFPHELWSEQNKIASAEE